MRKCRLLFIVLAILIALPCFAKKRIKLEGIWILKSKAPINEIPINAWVENDSKKLFLNFLGELGPIQVNITNVTGQVIYSQTVNSGAISSIEISMDKLTYTGCVLSITDGKNLVYGQIIY